MTPRDVVDLGAPLAHAREDYKVLALSGGGYRGVFTACVLEHLEAAAGQPLNKVFDLITGTSIGGILAVGLSLGVPAADLAEGLRTHGHAIFPQLRLGRLKQAVSSKYANEPLESAIKAILPSQHGLALETLDNELLVTAVSNTLFQPTLFGTGRYAKGNSELTVLDAMMATSAAPTYFPPWSRNGQSYVDGGLIANAPDLVALTESLNQTGIPIENHWMLSIGTVSPDAARAGAETLGNMGAFQWLKTQRLFELTITAQEQMAVQQAGNLLATRYLRIDPKPSKDQSKVIGLDKADSRATSTLEQLAHTAIEEINASDRQLLLSRLLS